MIDIITKIMKIKNENNMINKQIFPENPAYIAKLKRGDIKMPTEQSLRTIAANYEMSFDDLIHGTNWNKDKHEKVVQIKEFAISPQDIDCQFNESGSANINYKTYSLYNSNGEKNEFCPYSGLALITECSKCNRNIEYKNQLFCVKCGNKLIEFPPRSILYPDVDEILNKINIYSIDSLDEGINVLSGNKGFFIECINAVEKISNDLKNTIKELQSKKEFKELPLASFTSFINETYKLEYNEYLKVENFINADKSINDEALSLCKHKLIINSEIVDKAINYYKSKLPADYDYEERERVFQERRLKDPVYIAQRKDMAKGFKDINTLYDDTKSTEKSSKNTKTNKMTTKKSKPTKELVKENKSKKGTK